MATTTITINTSTYTALGSTETAVGCYVQRGQRVRLAAALTAPAAATTSYLPVEAAGDDLWQFVDFSAFGVGAGEEVYCLLERGAPRITVNRGTYPAGGTSSGTPGSPASAALTDASISSATGSSQTIAAANSARVVLNVSNCSATSWWINESGGTAAASTQGSFELTAGSRWTPRPVPTNAVTAIGTAAAKLTVVTG